MDYEEIHKIVSAAFEAKFGGKILRVSTGGAPSSVQVRNFVASLFHRGMGEGYGTTEAGGITSSKHIDRSVGVFVLYCIVLLSVAC